MLSTISSFIWIICCSILDYGVYIAFDKFFQKVFISNHSTASERVKRWQQMCATLALLSLPIFYFHHTPFLLWSLILLTLLISQRNRISALLNLEYGSRFFWRRSQEQQKHPQSPIPKRQGNIPPRPSKWLVDSGDESWGEECAQHSDNNVQRRRQPLQNNGHQQPFSQRTQVLQPTFTSKTTDAGGGGHLVPTTPYLSASAQYRRRLARPPIYDPNYHYDSTPRNTAAIRSIAGGDGDHIRRSEVRPAASFQPSMPENRESTAVQGSSAAPGDEDMSSGYGSSWCEAHVGGRARAVAPTETMSPSLESPLLDSPSWNSLSPAPAIAGLRLGFKTSTPLDSSAGRL